MDDPESIVLASIQKNTTSRDSSHFDFPTYVKQMKSTEIYHVENFKHSKEVS